MKKKSFVGVAESYARVFAGSLFAVGAFVSLVREGGLPTTVAFIGAAGMLLRVKEGCIGKSCCGLVGQKRGEMRYRSDGQKTVAPLGCAAVRRILKIMGKLFGFAEK